jgi:D-alanine-D-alanine ligase
LGAGIRNPESGIRDRFPLFVKPVAEGTGKGITNASKVENAEQLAAACRAIWQRFHQPALAETYLPGRELTVGIVGTGRDAQALGALEILLLDKAEAHAYSYQNKEYCEELVKYVLVEDALAKEAEAIALAAWRGLGCRDAGRVDLRADASGRLRFLEVNPLAGLHPQHSDLPILCTLRGIPYIRLIERIVASASQRITRRAAAP